MFNYYFRKQTRIYIYSQKITERLVHSIKLFAYKVDDIKFQSRHIFMLRLWRNPLAPTLMVNLILSNAQHCEMTLHIRLRAQVCSTLNQTLCVSKKSDNIWTRARIGKPNSIFNFHFNQLWHPHITLIALLCSLSLATYSWPTALPHFYFHQTGVVRGKMGKRFTRFSASERMLGNVFVYHICDK